MTSLDEINREFERLHQLMRQLDTLLDEARTLRRHVSVATARLALCLRDAEDESQQIAREPSGASKPARAAAAERSTDIRPPRT
jgi:hypothetical protein